MISIVLLWYLLGGSKESCKFRETHMNDEELSVRVVEGVEEFL